MPDGRGVPVALLDQAWAAETERARGTAAPARVDFDKAGGKDRTPRDSFDRAAGDEAATDKRESERRQKVRCYEHKKPKRRDSDSGR